MTSRPERIGRLVLTSCDYRDQFPPAMFAYFRPAARIPGAFKVLMAPMRPRSPATCRSRSAGSSSERSIGTPRTPTSCPGGHQGRGGRCETGDRRHSTRPTSTGPPTVCGGFEKPALIAWSREDKLFKPAHAERLAQDLPNARVEWVDDARTFSMEDNPAQLAQLIAGFVRQPAPAAATGSG